jgi:hypothetical protein
VALATTIGLFPGFQLSNRIRAGGPARARHARSPDEQVARYLAAEAKRQRRCARSLLELQARSVS